MWRFGWFHTKTDEDFWNRDKSTHYKYCSVWVDNLLYTGHDPIGFFKELMQVGYMFKAIYPPTYLLGVDFKYVKEPEDVITWYDNLN